MSIDQDYCTATSLTPDEVYELLRNNLEFVTRESKQGSSRTTLFTKNDGLQIATYPLKGSSRVEDAFGFRPTVRVDLYLARRDFEDYANLFRTVDWLINHVDGDAVLLFANGEFPVLLRSGDKIWLNDRDRKFLREKLALLTFPYDWKRLPTL